MKPSRTLQTFIPPLLGMVVLGLSVSVALLVQNQSNERLRSSQLTTLSELRSKLEGQLNGAINLTSGLIAYVSTHGGIDAQTFEAMAGHLLQNQTLVRNITLAPNNVIEFIYPQHGNEAALGLDLLAHDVQGFATRQMIRTGEPILAGPVELIQGGRGLIHRVPIFIADPHQPDEPVRYWGLMSTPLDYDRLLEVVGIEAVSSRMELAIRGIDGLGERGMPFYGNPQLFDRPDSLFSQVQVLGGSWQLAARPLQDHSPELRWLVGLLVAAGVLLSLLVGLFSWRIGRQAYQLETSERLYRELTEHLQDVVFQTDTARRITYLNPAWTALTGRPLQEVIGKDWVSLLDPEDRSRAEGRCVALINQSDPDELYFEEFRVSRREGDPLWMVIRANVHHDANGEVIGTIGTMVDISARRAAEQQIHHMAMHDNLTGLPNRRLLQDRFNQSQARMQRQHLLARNEGGLAFLFLDLDGFKAVNDNYGHDAGDQVLRTVARRFQSQLREVDTLARLGGDEFAVLLEYRGSEHEAAQVAQKLIDVIREPISAGPKVCQLGVSIGITFYPRDGNTLDELTSLADKAMYRAKGAGKNCWQIYHPLE